MSNEFCGIRRNPFQVLTSPLLSDGSTCRREEKAQAAPISGFISGIPASFLVGALFGNTGQTPEPVWVRSENIDAVISRGRSRGAILVEGPRDTDRMNIVLGHQQKKMKRRASLFAFDVTNLHDPLHGSLLRLLKDVLKNNGVEDRPADDPSRVKVFHFDRRKREYQRVNAETLKPIEFPKEGEWKGFYVLSTVDEVKELAKTDKDHDLYVVRGDRDESFDEQKLLQALGERTDVKVVVLDEGGAPEIRNVAKEKLFSGTSVEIGTQVFRKWAGERKFELLPKRDIGPAFRPLGKNGIVSPEEMEGLKALAEREIGGKKLPVFLAFGDLEGSAKYQKRIAEKSGHAAHLRIIDLKETTSVPSKWFEENKVPWPPRVHEGGLVLFSLSEEEKGWVPRAVKRNGTVDLTLPSSKIEIAPNEKKLPPLVMLSKPLTSLEEYFRLPSTKKPYSILIFMDGQNQKHVKGRDRFLREAWKRRRIESGDQPTVRIVDYTTPVGRLILKDASKKSPDLLSPVETRVVALELNRSRLLPVEEVEVLRPEPLEAPNFWTGPQGNVPEIDLVTMFRLSSPALKADIKGKKDEGRAFLQLPLNVFAMQHRLDPLCQDELRRLYVREKVDAFVEVAFAATGDAHYISKARLGTPFTNDMRCALIPFEGLVQEGFVRHAETRPGQMVSKVQPQDVKPLSLLDYVRLYPGKPPFDVVASEVEFHHIRDELKKREGHIRHLKGSGKWSDPLQVLEVIANDGPQARVLAEEFAREARDLQLSHRIVVRLTKTIQDPIARLHVWKNKSWHIEDDAYELGELRMVENVADWKSAVESVSSKKIDALLVLVGNEVDYLPNHAQATLHARRALAQALKSDDGLHVDTDVGSLPIQYVRHIPASLAERELLITGDDSDDRKQNLTQRYMESTKTPQFYLLKRDGSKNVVLEELGLRRIVTWPNRILRVQVLEDLPLLKRRASLLSLLPATKGEIATYQRSLHQQKQELGIKKERKRRVIIAADDAGTARVEKARKTEDQQKKVQEQVSWWTQAQKVFEKNASDDLIGYLSRYNHVEGTLHFVVTYRGMDGARWAFVTHFEEHNGDAYEDLTHGEANDLLSILQRSWKRIDLPSQPTSSSNHTLKQGGTFRGVMKVIKEEGVQFQWLPFQPE